MPNIFEVVGNFTARLCGKTQTEKEPEFTVTYYNNPENTNGKLFPQKPITMFKVDTMPKQQKPPQQRVKPANTLKTILEDQETSERTMIL